MDFFMKARERLLVVAVALVLGLGVVLPGFAIYGDGSNNSVADDYADTINNEQEKYIAKNADEYSEADKYGTSPALLGVIPLGTNHYVSNEEELADALDIINDGDTITLMDLIIFEQRIHIYDRTITLVTNGFTLHVFYQIWQPGLPALQVNNGALLLDDSNGGEFHVRGYYGVRVTNGKAEVTNAGGTGGYGGFAGLGGSLYVRNSALSHSGHSVWAQDGGVVTVDGHAGGARAQEGSVININGNVSEHGAWAQDGGVINIYGRVSADFSDGARAINGGIINISGSVSGRRGGVYAHGVGSVVIVDGDVTSSLEETFGVVVLDGATAMINGTITTGGRYSVGVLASGVDSFVGVSGNVWSAFHGVVAENGGVIVVEGNAGVTRIGGSFDAPAAARADGVNSEVIVRGNIGGVRGSTGVNVAQGAKITVYGNVTAGNTGVFAAIGGIANVGGNVSMPGYFGSRAVFTIGENAVINIAGDVCTGEFPSFTTAAVTVWDGGLINIGGNVTTLNLGTHVRNSGYIRISGTLTAPSKIEFAQFIGVYQTPTNYVTPTTLPGYFTYTNTPVNPTSTVWIRGNLAVTSLTAATPSLPYTGGTNLITLTGTDFGAANIRIAAFLNNTGNALYTQTPTSTPTQATTTLNFPVNTTNAIRNYTIKMSIDGGITWLTAPTTTVTIAPDVTGQPPLSNDATLNSLFTAPGILTPAFDPNVLEYTVSVGNHVTAINAFAIPNCQYATVATTGYNLTDGQNTVTVLITAQDGTTRTYTFTITVTRATAVVRLHWHIPGAAQYTEIGLPETNTTIPTNLRPTIPIRHGTIGSPGWAFLGWYEELFPYMHYINNQNSITHTQRLAAIDLLSNLVITEAMLDDNGVYELHASWLQYGDLSGDGTISPLDRSLMQNRLLGGLTNDDMVMQTANLDKSEANITPTDRSLLQNHILGAPGVILPSL